MIGQISEAQPHSPGSRQTSVPQRKTELWRVRHPLPTLIFNLDEALVCSAKKRQMR